MYQRNFRRDALLAARWAVSRHTPDGVYLALTFGTLLSSQGADAHHHQTHAWIRGYRSCCDELTFTPWVIRAVRRPLVVIHCSRLSARS